MTAEAETTGRAVARALTRDGAIGGQVLDMTVRLPDEFRPPFNRSWRPDFRSRFDHAWGARDGAMSRFQSFSGFAQGGDAFIEQVVFLGGQRRRVEFAQALAAD